MIGIILVILVAVVLIYGIAAYNGFIRLRNDVREAFATMDVYLKKRYDLIPNLVETVKGYAKHESETLQKVTDARASVMQAATPSEKLKKENFLTRSLGQLLAVAEAYPDLKASTNFNELMQQLERVEEDIANARKFYNAVVNKFNTRCESFPSNIIAKLFHFEEEPMFETDEDSRENVKVDFGA